MKIFIQTSVNVWIHKNLFKKKNHLKDNKNCVGGFASKIYFIYISKH
jgi:hypothetical protein